MKRLRAWTGIAALLVLVPACGGSAPAAPRGTVTRRLQIEGRMSAGQGRRPIPGTVRFTGAHQQRVVVGVGRSGTFRVRLAPGTYAVCWSGLGTSQCSPTWKITVVAGRTARTGFAFAVP
ncbi:MAG: hypothetical protein ACLPN6_01210 [Streptosporangiaceae bacterium]|jgi:hypothetical protein